MERDNIHGRDVQDSPVHGHELCNVQDMSRTFYTVYSIPIYIYVINNCKIASISASSDSILMIYYDSLDSS